MEKALEKHWKKKNGYAQSGIEEFKFFANRQFSEISFRNLVRSDCGSKGKDAKLNVYQNSVRLEIRWSASCVYEISRNRGLRRKTIYYNEYCLSRLESRIPRNTL